MNFQIGDIVSIIHSKENGEVVDVINDKMLMVKVGSINFPVYKDQIEFFQSKQLKIDSVIKHKQLAITSEEGVWVKIVPVLAMNELGEELVKKLKISLSNSTQQALRFLYKLSYKGNQKLEIKDKIPAMQEIFLNDIFFEEISDYPFLQFEFSLVENDKKKKQQQHSVSLKLKPKQFFLKMEELRLKNNDSFSFLLFNEFPNKVEEFKPEYDSVLLQKNIFEVSKTRESLRLPRSVIDLHIEKLTENYQQMSNLEILTLQLKALEVEVELSIAHLQPSLIVIHGIGKGKLKNEIHAWLQNRTEVKSFVNQYDSRFGYGSTEIIFQYR